MEMTELEKAKLSLEREKLQIEKDKSKLEARFLFKHLGAIVTAVISLAAVLVSASQIWVARIDKEKELEISKLQRAKEIEMAQIEQNRRWNLDIASFVSENSKIIFSKDPAERERIRNVLLVTFPPDITKALFEKIEIAVPAGERKTWIEGMQVAAQLKRFKISIMGAERVIIEWRPKEFVMTEEVLIKRGVNVSKVKEAIGLMFSALANRNPKDVILLPGEHSEYMPGPAYSISSLGVNNEYFDSFHVYQKDDEISVSLYKSGNYIPILEPEEVGIDWISFKKAAARGLALLYTDDFSIEFGKIKMIEYSDESWNYIIPYLLRPVENKPEN